MTVVQPGLVRYLRTGLPAAGAVSEQEHWLLAALETLKAIKDTLAAEEIGRLRKKRGR